MSTFLERVVDEIESDLVRRKGETPAEELRAQIGPAPRGRPFSEALVAEGISLIAEMKRASPSRGPIRPDAAVGEVVRTYEAAGASAASILTETRHFGGSLDDLAEAREACSLPLLRKDFVVDDYQLLEARRAGADASLLIVAALSDERLAALIATTAEIGLDALVEVHDEDEIERALRAGAEVIGINNRDLRSLEVDLETSFRLLPEVPAGTVV
ncbi:MAG: indole-3-glycerol phosphate synthase TrpC, partial [Miltoncostaeaceae bacterium]